MSEIETLEKWQVSTRLLANPDTPIIILEYLGKGSAKNFNVVIDGFSETYKAGGRWKYIAVQPQHAPFLMKPREEGKPALFVHAPNAISSKILAYNNARAEAKQKNTKPVSERNQMFVLDGMIAELKSVTENARNSDITKERKNKNKTEKNEVSEKPEKENLEAE